jgi:hypothetical protein
MAAFFILRSQASSAIACQERTSALEGVRHVTRAGQSWNGYASKMPFMSTGAQVTHLICFLIPAFPITRMAGLSQAAWFSSHCSDGNSNDMCIHPWPAKRRNEGATNSIPSTSAPPDVAAPRLHLRPTNEAVHHCNSRLPGSSRGDASRARAQNFLEVIGESTSETSSED